MGEMEVAVERSKTGQCDFLLKFMEIAMHLIIFTTGKGLKCIRHSPTLSSVSSSDLFLVCPNMGRRVSSC